MAIVVSQLSFGYAQKEVLRDISFTTQENSLLAVLGPNGVGKSTLFRCLLGLLPGYSGSILLDGEEARRLPAQKLARKIAYIPQSQQQIFPYPVLDMVLMGTTAQLSPWENPGARQRELAEQALEQLQITHLAQRNFNQISGGEAQLVLLARALAQQARTLILDEPTANLDYGNTFRVLEQIRSLADQGYSILLSTHNPDHALAYCHQALALLQGSVIAQGPAREVIHSDLLFRLYGVRVKVESFYQDKLRLCIPQSGFSGKT